MALVIVGLGGTQTINSSETDSVVFLGLGTLNIAGTPAAPITVVLSQVAGVGLLNTINITDARATLGGVAGVSALGDYRIGSGGTLVLASTLGVSVGSTVNFTAPNSQLVLGAGIDLTLLGGIGGFGPGSTIDVSAVAASVTYADNAGANTGGVLTLRGAGGGAVGSLNLLTGDFSAGSFTLTPDGGGGTLVGFAATVTGVTATPSTDNLGIGRTATITLSTSNPVTVAGGAPTLTLSDGGVATYNAAASTPSSLVFTHVVAAGQNTPDLAVVGLSLNGASVTDGAGGAVNLAAAVANPAGTLQVDGTAPAVAGVATLPGSGALGVGQTVSITVTPTEAVTVTGGPPTLTLSSGGTATYSPGASTPTALVFTTVIAAGQNAADLAITSVGLNGAVIADGAGNALDLSGVVTNPPGVLTVDTTAPVVLSVVATPATALLGIGQTATITLAASEAVTVAGGTPTLSLNDGGTATFNPGASTATSLVFTTTVLAGQNAADLAVTGAALNGATIVDAAGNAISLAAAVVNPAGTLQVDGTAPTVAGVTTSPASGTVGVGQTVSITVTPTEAVTVVGGTPTLSLSSGGTATYNPGASTPTALVFTTVIAAGQNAPDLAVTGISLNGAAIRDAAGNTADLSGVVTNPAGVLAVDTQYRPFAALVAANADPLAVMTVSAATRPAVGGVFGSLGGGTIGPDGATYTVTGTAAQVSAALAAVTLVVSAGSPAVLGVTASVTDPSSGSVSQLIDTGALASVLTAASANEVVQAGSGADTLIAGSSGNVLRGGSGGGVLVGSTAGSLVIGGSGSSVLFSQGGTTQLFGGGARDTFSAAVGDVTIVTATGGRAVVGLGTGPAIVNSQGAADTLIGGSGSLVAGLATGGVAMLGTGTAIISAAQGSTVVGGAGADTVGVRGSGITFFAGSGPAYFIGGTDASTVQGGAGGSSIIFGGAGGGLLNGGSAGNNLIIGGQKATTIFGGGSGDVLFAQGSAGTVITAGSGNETLQGIGSSGNDTFFAGSGNNLIGLGSGQNAVFGGTGNATVVAGTGRDVFAFTQGRAGGTESIIGFKMGIDQVSLQGYAPGETGRALAGATSFAGSATNAPSTTLTLSDNTRITFLGMASVDGRVFG